MDHRHYKKNRNFALKEMNSSGGTTASEYKSGISHLKSKKSSDQLSNLKRSSLGIHTKAAKSYARFEKPSKEN